MDGRASFGGHVPGDLATTNEEVHVLASVLNNQTIDMLAELARRTGTPYPLVYDTIIRCLGWKHDTALYQREAPEQVEMQAQKHDVDDEHHKHEHGQHSEGGEGGGADTESGDAGSSDIPAAPLMQDNGKYPVLNAAYESANVRGMYFAGTLAHGKDFKRSAGGFIHGFRYTTRALFRILAAAANQTGNSRADESTADATSSSIPRSSSSSSSSSAAWLPVDEMKEHHSLQAWDGVSVGLKANGCNAGDWGTQAPLECEQQEKDEDEEGRPNQYVTLLDRIFSRINVASGPYQMVSVLGDGIVFGCAERLSAAGGGHHAGTNVSATYLEEIPAAYFNQQFSTFPRLFWSFAYGMWDAFKCRDMHLHTPFLPLLLFSQLHCPVLCQRFNVYLPPFPTLSKTKSKTYRRAEPNAKDVAN